MKTTRILILALLFTVIFAVGISAEETFFLSYPEETGVAIVLDRNTVTLRNLPQEESFRYIWLVLTDIETGEEQYSHILIKDGTYDLTFHSGKLDDGIYTVEIYANSERYGTFVSYINGSARIHVSDGVSSFVMSPVYEQNQALAKTVAEESPAQFLALSTNDPVMRKLIRDLATAITVSAETDYERIWMIHNWIARNLYYDYDYYFHKTEETEHDTVDVLRSRKAVCHGYSSVTTDLIRALGIPCRRVYGYALGLGTNGLSEQEWLKKDVSNHVWNEAYLDGRWIILDPTWDSANRYENGIYEEENANTLYFDCSPEMIAFDRKTLSYESVTDVRLDEITPIFLEADWEPRDGIALPETLTLYENGAETAVSASWSHKTAEFCYENVLRVDGYVRLSDTFYQRHGYNRIRTAIYCVLGELPTYPTEEYAWLAPWLNITDTEQNPADEESRLLAPVKRTVLRTQEIQHEWQAVVFFGVLSISIGILWFLYIGSHQKNNKEKE